MVFRSTLGIEKGLSEVAKVALDKTLDEFLDELGKIIEEDVYRKYTPKSHRRRMSGYFLLCC